MVVRGADAWHAPVGSRTMATATGTAPRTAAAGPPGSPACPAPGGAAWLMASRISPRISPAPCERDERDMEESKNRHEVVTSLDLGGENQRGKRWEEEINPKA